MASMDMLYVIVPLDECATEWQRQVQPPPTEFWVSDQELPGLNHGNDAAMGSWYDSELVVQGERRHWAALDPTHEQAFRLRQEYRNLGGVRVVFVSQEQVVEAYRRSAEGLNMLDTFNRALQSDGPERTAKDFLSLANDPLGIRHRLLLEKVIEEASSVA